MPTRLSKGGRWNNLTFVVEGQLVALFATGTVAYSTSTQGPTSCLEATALSQKNLLHALCLTEC